MTLEEKNKFIDSTLLECNIKIKDITAQIKEIEMQLFDMENNR